MNIPLISIITVSYNAVDTIKETINSVINQTYPNIEYIIIDGGSIDGTVDIIKKHENKIAFWISEPDKGIYDAMNKGIQGATGEWINFMNCGDVFANTQVLQSIFDKNNYKEFDVIYGNSYKITRLGNKTECISSDNANLLKYHPIYRHGASFVRTAIHKNIPFDLTQKKFGYALDFNCINTIYISGYKFIKHDGYILTYEEDGISNHPLRSLYYNYLISIKKRFSIKALLYFIKSFILTSIHDINYKNK